MRIYNFMVTICLDNIVRRMRLRYLNWPLGPILLQQMRKIVSRMVILPWATKRGQRRHSSAPLILHRQTH
jgi:hypothetical protein